MPLVLAGAAVLVLVAVVLLLLNPLGGSGVGTGDATAEGGNIVTSRQPVVPPINQVGDRIEFGTWRGEPITWRVLALEDGKALVISEDILTARQYDDLGSSTVDEVNFGTTWAESDIRAWLNSDFLNAAFTKSEQDAINLSHLVNEYNSGYGQLSGADTEDKVFLLNVDEANRYFTSNEDRIANFTMTEEDVQYLLHLEREYFQISQEELASFEDTLRTNNLGQTTPSFWWLRSLDSSGINAGGIVFDGTIIEPGFSVYLGFDVRPALWLNL